MGFSHRCDFHHLADSTDTTCVRLHYVNNLPLNQLAYAPYMGMAFSSSNGYINIVLYSLKRFDIVRWHWVFIKKKFVRFERLANYDGVFGSKPGWSVSVHHYVHFISYRFSNRINLFYSSMHTTSLYSSQPAFFQLQRSLGSFCMTVGTYTISNLAA